MKKRGLTFLLALVLTLTLLPFTAAADKIDEDDIGITPILATLDAGPEALPITRSIAAGNCFAFAVKSNGDLYAWGNNWHGRLGDGTDKDRPIPVLIAENVTAVAAGDVHSMALKKDGTVWAWAATQTAKLATAKAANMPTR